jgi:hypothetical protein
MFLMHCNGTASPAANLVFCLTSISIAKKIERSKYRVNGRVRVRVIIRVRVRVRVRA